MIKKARLQIALLLPDVPDSRDGCVRRLRNLLQFRPGVEVAHIVEREDGLGDICVHFDEGQIDLAEIRQIAQLAGLKMSQRYGHLLLVTDAMYARKARTFEEHLRQIRGVLGAAVAPTGVVRVEFDRQAITEQSLRALISQWLGASEPVLSETKTKNAAPDSCSQPGDHDHSHHGGFGERLELIFVACCGVLLLTGWLASFSAAVPSWLPLGFYIGAYFFGGFFAAREALENLLTGRFEIDSLMLAAAAGAAALGDWSEGALLLLLFSLGHGLEHYAMGRARRAIESLSKLAPEEATVRRDGKEERVRVTELRVADIVIVKPNERIPADGFVVQGESSVNQAPITGESIPVDKSPVPNAEVAAKAPDKLDARHRLFAGTINERGLLEMYVAATGNDSTLARIIQMVSEAETQKSATQRFTDRFEQYFVPIVLVLVVILLLLGGYFNEPFMVTFYRAMAVLVAASPCALAISTPSAVLSGIARGAQSGVLVKGGGPLEVLGGLQAIAFDKTGTITEGKPKLTDVVPAEGIADSELLQVALAVERYSDHPLAAAVAQGATDRLQGRAELDARDVRSITGRGVQGVVLGEEVHIGNAKLFEEIGGATLPEAVAGDAQRLGENGRSTMIVRSGGRYLGVLGLMDAPRASAKQVIAALRRQGINKLLMLSGDHPNVAAAIAKEVGIDEVRGGLMPDDKVTAIQQLRKTTVVGMVGDGVNDAPAMVNAEVGIAMGAIGSAVALETADVALMEDDLRKLPFAVGLGRKTRSIIRQNLWISLGVVAILIPATLFGLGIGAAVIFHEGATMVVVINALRLLAYRETIE